LFFFQAEDGIRDFHVTGVQTCALPICRARSLPEGLSGRAVLPGRERVLYLAVSYCDQYRQELSCRSRATPRPIRRGSAGPRAIRGVFEAQGLGYARRLGVVGRDTRGGQWSNCRSSRRSTHRDPAARDRRHELRGDRADDGVPGRHRPIEDIPRAGSDRQTYRSAASITTAMSEQIHDQVSAFLDDELSAEECAFLVRRIERDPEARDKLVRYSLIGSALREELLPPVPYILRR